MELSIIKTTIGIIAIALVFVGYAPYIVDVFKGTTKPHIFSWFIWGLAAAIIYALQVSAGAGFGSLVTGAVAVISLCICILGFKYGTRDIKRSDIVFLALALCAIPLWLVVKQPILSIVLLSTIDMLGFAPTVRKTWNDPHSETLLFYIITTFRHGLSIIALEHYNIVTTLFPITWAVANALFAMMLIARRAVVAQPPLAKQGKKPILPS